jgi:hypothetical protein
MILRNASALISSASKRASCNPTHAPPRHPQYTISQYRQHDTNFTPMSPPANMANPWKGSDVAAKLPLSTLSAAVVQRPLALKMSTALLQAVPTQRITRITVRLQRLKAHLPPQNTRPPPPSHITHNLPISTTQTKITNQWNSRQRIWPIPAQAVTSLQDKILPR